MTQVVVTADDYGLTRHNTDDILAAADRGAVTRVSILANGFVFDYAIAEFLQRPALELSVHLNLTEGRSLTPPADAPHLVNMQGHFRYSPAKLLLRTFFASPRTRKILAEEIQGELVRQIEKVRTAAPSAAFAVDGHQHVHMVPLVFSAVASLHLRYGFTSVRIPYEPFFFDTASLGSYFSLGLIRHNVLNMLSQIMRRQTRGLPHPDFFIGTCMSGRLTLHSVLLAMNAAIYRRAKWVEIGTHPGRVLPGELSAWTGDIGWHYSPWRTRERTMLLSSEFRTFVRDASYTSSNFWEIVRFLISGMLAACIHLSLLYVLTEYISLWYLYSTAIAWSVAFMASFILHKFWTFTASIRTHHMVRKQAIKYFVLQSANAIFNVAGMYMLVSYLQIWYLQAQIVVALVLAVWTYILSRYFIFTHE